MTRTGTVRTGTVRTDGADLYFERRGHGPALLMISGGLGDAGHYTRVAGPLAERYTVLTYDRRGNSRSIVDDRDAPLRMDQQSADARAVLEHNDFGSALVFGCSGGALVGLDLAARHPDAVEALIAHEPPVIDWLPDAATYRALFDEIDDITRRDGPWPAFLRFITTVDRADSPALVRNRTGRRLLAGPLRGALWLAARGPRPLREVARLLGNADYLMTREAASFLAFEPDLAALSGGGTPVVLGAGARSRPYYPCRAGEAVAERLGVEVVEFPGGHSGYMDHPGPFAAVLCDTLDRMRRPVG